MTAIPQRLLSVLFAAFASIASAAPAGDVLPFKASQRTLPNGLKVIVVPTGLPNIVSLQIPVRTGSRNEVEPGKSGFAHFFEHMMFRGTKQYSPAAYNAIITRAGARDNAYTTDDYTNYHITFAREDLAKMLEIEADKFQNLAYSEDAFRTEARAVLGEYNKNNASTFYKVFEAQRKAAFATHTYRHTTMGFIEDIEDMPNQFAYSKQFYSRWYRPENTTVIVAGDVRADEVFSLVQKYWGAWKPAHYKFAVPQEPAAKGPVYAHVEWKSPTLPLVTVAFHGPAFSDKTKDAAAINLLLDLEFGEASAIHKQLVQDEQKVDRLFYWNSPHVDPGLYTVLARVKKEADTPYVRDQILKALARMRDTPAAQDRLAQAKSSARYTLLRDMDNTEAVASALATYVHFERSYDTINNYYRVLASVTPADVQAAARKYITDTNLVIATLSSAALPPAIATPAPLASFNAAGATQAPQLRVLQNKTLLPQLNIKLLFATGSASDPAGRQGLAALAARSLAEGGSQAMRFDEIKKVLFPMAGKFSAQVDKEMTTFSATVHRDNWQEFFDAVLPQIVAPGFRSDDFQRVRDAQRHALQQDLRASDEEELAKQELHSVLYRGTPYAHPAVGTLGGIARISLDDVENFAAEHYTRANLVVGISGDYPPELLAALTLKLASLPEGKTAATRMQSLQRFEGRKPQGLEVEIISKPARATAISMGFPIPLTRADADFAALNVARTWLGEHRMSSGRLFNRMREIRGLNYGDYAYIEYFPAGGANLMPPPNAARRSQAFEIWLRPVVPANATMATRIALHELQQLIDNGLSEEAFQATREYLMKNVYLLTSTQDALTGYALDSWWYGTPAYVEHMRGQYSRLTRDDVNRAVRKYLSATDVSIVYVAEDAEGLRQQLLAPSAPAIKYDSPIPAAIIEEDKMIGAEKLVIAPDKIRIVPVESVFAD